MSLEIGRRTVLRGGLAAVALPWLEAFAPRRAAAAEEPWRLVVMLLPNSRLELGLSGAPEPLSLAGGRYAVLAKHESRLLHLVGLQNEIAGGVVANGRHAVAIPAWGAAVSPERGQGDSLWNGVSVDQAVVNAWPASPIPSLVLGTDGPEQATCFPGWACAYRHHLSWSTPSTPLPKIVDPAALFDLLFLPGGGNGGEGLRARRRSVLDLVREDATRLSARLGVGDRARMDEYLTSVRTLERRLSRTPPPVPAGVVRPRGIGSFQGNFRLMADLGVLALQLGETRVVSMLYGYSGHLLVYDWLGATRDHHGLVHMTADSGTEALLERIEAFQYDQVGYLLDALAKAQVGGGSLADRTFVVVGHEFGDAAAHSHLQHHVFIRVPPGAPLRAGVKIAPVDRPLGDVHLTVLRALGLQVQRFGATGREVIREIQA
jgi:hypothetical protein